MHNIAARKHFLLESMRYRHEFTAEQKERVKHDFAAIDALLDDLMEVFNLAYQQTNAQRVQSKKIDMRAFREFIVKQQPAGVL